MVQTFESIMVRDTSCKSEEEGFVVNLKGEAGLMVFLKLDKIWKKRKTEKI